LRAAVRAHFDILPPGWDVVLIARRSMLQADFEQTQKALAVLLHKAKLIRSEARTGSL